ncbi:21704_t:CDS:1, partial [Racocetra persica]
REPLPLTYYELNSRVRHFFPIDPSLEETNIQDIAKTLRKYYKFRSIPNDFFVQKPTLPQNPNKLKLHTQYTYPITDNKI